MKTEFQLLMAFEVLLVSVFFSNARAEDSVSDSTEVYQKIVRNESDLEVRNAIAKLSGHYQADLEAGRISVESDRELILQAIPIIIDQMDDADKEFAIQVFKVLASIQADCPAPRKKYWQDWWNRKQAGERIIWAIQFTPDTEE